MDDSVHDIPEGHPIMIAWNKHVDRATANNKTYSLHESLVMWTAFVRGFYAGQQNPDVIIPDRFKDETISE